MPITKEQYEFLLDWIERNFIHQKTCNYNRNSGSLRSTFEFSPEGFYVDGETFKQAMLDCGYVPSSKRGTYWKFNVSEKSPAIRKYYYKD